MCYFITLVTPSCDAAALSDVLQRLGRLARPIDNPSIRSVLLAGETQYLTTPGDCDCGTVLSHSGEPEESLESKLSKEAERLRRKGWSEAKVKRSMDSRRTAANRPKPKSADSLDLWIAVLDSLKQHLRLPYAGVFLRNYSGDTATEIFNASRRVVSAQALLRNELTALREDEVTIFSFRPL